MLDALLLVIAVGCSAIGFACLALAIKVHWEQVIGQQDLQQRMLVMLRMFGVAGLVLSLVFCLIVDHATMALLVWIMALAAAALIVAFTLTWRPKLFQPLVIPVRWAVELASQKGFFLN